MSQLCDVYGLANLNRDDTENRLHSKCIFNGNVIKKYVIPEGWCFTFKEYLYFGVQKPAQVKKLQTILRKEGRLYGDKIDGIFDYNVFLGVKDFQRAHNIYQTGTVGPTTRAKLNSLYGCKKTTQPSIKVTSPNGGETWERGKPYNITWESNGVTEDVIVNIKNNGTCAGSCLTFVTTGISASAGTVPFTVPPDFPLGDKYDVRVGTGGSDPIEDRSNGYFSIIPALPSAYHCEDLNHDYKIDGTEFNRIAAYWRAGAYHIDSAGVDGYAAGEGNHNGAYNCADYNHNWVIDNDEYLRVKTYFDTGCYIVNSAGLDGFANCTTQPSIRVDSPDGGETWKVGETHDITWTSSNIPSGNNISIALTNLDTQVIGIYIATNIPSSQNSYSWTVSSSTAPGTRYRMRIEYNTTTTSGFDESNNFTIAEAVTTCTPNWQTGQWSTCVNGNQTRTVTDLNNCGTTTGMPTVSQNCSIQPSITVTSPNGGETWKVGETHDITWNSQGVNKVVIQLLNPPSTIPVATIASGISASIGSYNWDIPSTINPSNNYQISIFNFDGSAALGLSHNYFTIAEAAASCTGYANNSVVLNSMQNSNGIVSFNLTNTTSSAQTVSVSIGSGSVSQSVISVPSGACAIPNSITYSASSNTTITFAYSGQIIASLSVLATAPVAESPTSYLTLTSPNGAESWRKGGTYDIKWSNNNLPAGTTVSIALVSGYNNAKIKDIALRIPVDVRSASFTIPASPSDVPIGRYYKIKIVSSWYSSIIYDLSDNYFSIDNSVASNSSSDNILNNAAASLANIAQQLRELLTR